MEERPWAIPMASLYIIPPLPPEGVKKLGDDSPDGRISPKM